MAQKKTRTAAPKKTTRKKRPPARKKVSPGFFAAIGLTRLVTYLVLLIVLVVSLAVASYVIFFRVVVADNAPGGGITAGWTCSLGAQGFSPAPPHVSSWVAPAPSDLRIG
jgi:hypothetical protein